jgi:predicted  nucleic acid-binding Zn-ribbon protein
MYNQENINKSIELIDSMINVMAQQAKEMEEIYHQITKRSAEIDIICENIKSLENQIMEMDVNTRALECELKDNVYECKKAITDIQMISDYLMEQQEGIESIKDLQKSIYELQSNLY